MSFVSIKPTEKPAWTSTTVGSIIAPDPAKKIFGWTTEKPPFQNFNWFWTLMSKWVDYVCVLHNDENITFNGCDTEDKFMQAIDYINHIRVNNGIITVNDYVGALTVPLTLKNIKGTGSIVINCSVDVEYMRIEDVSNPVTFNFTTKVLHNPSSTVHGFDLLRSSSVTFSRLETSFSGAVGETASVLTRHIYIEDSVLNCTQLVCDGGTLLGFLSKYVVEVGKNSTFNVTGTNSFTITGDHMNSTGFAYIYKHDTGYVNITTPTFSTHYPMLMFSEYFDSGADIIVTNSADFANNVHKMLSNIKRLDADLYVDLSYRKAGTTLTIEGIYGKGKLHISSLAADYNTKAAFLYNAVPIIITTANISKTGAPATTVFEMLYNQLSIIGTIRMLVTDSSPSYCCHLSGKHIIGNAKIHVDSTISADDRYILISDGADVKLSTITIEPDFGAVPITLNASSLRVNQSVVEAGRSAGVKLTYASELICRNPGPDFNAFYNGNTAVL